MTRPTRYRLRLYLVATRMAIRILLIALTAVDVVRLWPRYPRGY